MESILQKIDLIKKEQNFFAFLLILIVVVIIGVFTLYCTLNILRSASIAEPLSITIDGLNQTELQRIQVFIFTFRGVEKEIFRVNENSSKWLFNEGWTTGFQIVALNNIQEKIEVEIGKKKFVFDFERIKKEWLIKIDKSGTILEPPKEVRHYKSLIPKLGRIINWPGDYALLKSVFFRSILINLLLIFLTVIFRKEITIKIAKIHKSFNLKVFLKKSIKLIKSQYIAIILIFITIVLFFQPGQGNRGTAENLQEFFIYFYYIVLNFFSFYAKNKFLSILQFLIGFFLISATIINIKKIVKPSNNKKLKKEVIKKGPYKTLKFNKNTAPYYLIFIIVILTSFIIHINYRNIHFQECDSAFLYPAIYNFPESAYLYLSWSYPADNNWLRNLRTSYVSTIANLNLPHAIKSSFAVSWGSTVPIGVGFIYGIINSANANYEAFVSNTTLVTIILFHLCAILIFLLCIKLKLNPIISILSSFLFLFSVSMYSYAYHLGNTIWGIFIGFVWLAILILAYPKKTLLSWVSLATGLIIILFNYLIIFYWAAFLLAYLLFFKKNRELKYFLNKFYFCFVAVFFGTIILGILGFAPSRHILFLSPILFLMVSMGINDLVLRYEKKGIYIVLLIMIMLVGFLSLSQNLKDAKDLAAPIKIDSDIDKIIIGDCSYNLVYKNWNIKKPIEFANPNNFQENKTYLYLSQTTSFDKAFKQWYASKYLKIEKINGFEEITNTYFVAYNPDPDKFKHNRPNNLFYQKFKILNMG